MTILGPTPTTVVQVVGADRLTYLEAVTTQRLVDIEPGEVRGAMYLDAKGSPVAAFEVVAQEDALLLLVPQDLTETVMQVLGGRTFLSDATFTHLEGQAVRALRGEGATEAAEAHGLYTPAGHARAVGEITLVGRVHGTDLVGPKEALDELSSKLFTDGVTTGSAGDVRAEDIAAGVPAWGAEIRPPHLPEELGLLPSHVHLAKGCYPGQEAVARMWMLGRPRRALASVEVEGEPHPGWSTGSGKKKVELTSIAGSRALAFVPADATAGDRFTDDQTTLTVRHIVGADIPVPGHDPKVQRRRDKRSGATTASE